MILHFHRYPESLYESVFSFRNCCEFFGFVLVFGCCIKMEYLLQGFVFGILHVVCQKNNVVKVNGFVFSSWFVQHTAILGFKCGAITITIAMVMIHFIILAPSFHNIIVIILFSVCMETTIDTTASKISNVANCGLGFGFRRYTSSLTTATCLSPIPSQHEDTGRQHLRVVLILFGILYVFGDLFIVNNKGIDGIAAHANECELIKYGSQCDFDILFKDVLCVSRLYPTPHTPKLPYPAPTASVDSLSEREGVAGPILIKPQKETETIFYISLARMFFCYFFLFPIVFLMLIYTRLLY